MSSLSYIVRIFASLWFLFYFIVGIHYPHAHAVVIDVECSIFQQGLCLIDVVCVFCRPSTRERILAGGDFNDDLYSQCSDVTSFCAPFII